jgi:hypothetical protein
MTFPNVRSAAAVAAAVVALSLAGASAGAQQQDPRLLGLRDDATRGVVMEQVSSAAAFGLPTEPLWSKAFEGVARKASSSKIRAAMDALQKRLRRANALLAPSPTVEELSAGADALSVGVPENTLKLMRRAAPRKSIAVELGVLTELVARNVSPKRASEMILALMARGATGAQLIALNAAVQSDVAAGLTPEAALERHGRGVMSLLPPPPAVFNGNTRPR